MERLLFVLAGYGILRGVIDVVAFFRLQRQQLENLREEEAERQKTKAMQKRHDRIGVLLAKKRFPAGTRSLLDGPEAETIDIELLTLLQEALKEEGPCEFYEQWRDQLVRWYASQPKIGS